jgi:hypothetical protein
MAPMPKKPFTECIMNNISLMEQCIILLKIFIGVFLQLWKDKVLQHIKLNVSSEHGFVKEKWVVHPCYKVHYT